MGGTGPTPAPLQLRRISQPQDRAWSRKQGPATPSSSPASKATHHRTIAKCNRNAITHNSACSCRPQPKPACKRQQHTAWTGLWKKCRWRHYRRRASNDATATIPPLCSTRPPVAGERRNWAGAAAQQPTNVPTRLLNSPESLLSSYS